MATPGKHENPPAHYHANGHPCCLSRSPVAVPSAEQWLNLRANQALLYT